MQQPWPYPGAPRHTIETGVPVDTPFPPMREDGQHSHTDEFWRDVDAGCLPAYLWFRDRARQGDFLDAPHGYARLLAADLARGWVTGDLDEAIRLLQAIPLEPHPSAHRHGVRWAAGLAYRRAGLAGFDEIAEREVRAGRSFAPAEHLVRARPGDHDLLAGWICGQYPRHPRATADTGCSELDTAFTTAVRTMVQGWDGWRPAPLIDVLGPGPCERRSHPLMPDLAGQPTPWVVSFPEGPDLRLRPILPLLDAVAELVATMVRVRAGEWPQLKRRPAMPDAMSEAVIAAVGGFGPRGNPYRHPRRAPVVAPAAPIPEAIPEVRSAAPVEVDLEAILRLHREADETAARLAVGEPGAERPAPPPPVASPAVAAPPAPVAALVERLRRGPAGRGELRTALGQGVLVDGLIEEVNGRIRQLFGDDLILEEEGRLILNPDLPAEASSTLEETA